MSGLFTGDERKDLERRMRAANRLPPGQAATLKWPVLHYGSVPKFDPATWDFRIFGLVAEPVRRVHPLTAGPPRFAARYRPHSAL